MESSWWPKKACKLWAELASLSLHFTQIYFAKIAKIVQAWLAQNPAFIRRLERVQNGHIDMYIFYYMRHCQFIHLGRQRQLKGVLIFFWWALYIYIKERCLSLCLSACSEWEPNLQDGFQQKFGMGHSMVHLVNIDILLLGTSTTGGRWNFRKTKKKLLTWSLLPPLMRQNKNIAGKEN